MVRFASTFQLVRAAVRTTVSSTHAIDAWQTEYACAQCSASCTGHSAHRVLRQMCSALGASQCHTAAQQLLAAAGSSAVCLLLSLACSNVSCMLRNSPYYVEAFTSTHPAGCDVLLLLPCLSLPCLSMVLLCSAGFLPCRMVTGMHACTRQCWGADCS